MLLKSSRWSKTLRQSLARLSDYVRAEQRAATRHARKSRQVKSWVQTWNLGDTSLVVIEPTDHALEEHRGRPGSGELLAVTHERAGDGTRDAGRSTRRPGPFA